MKSRIVFRPWTGVALTVVIWVVVAVSLGSMVVGADVLSLRRFGPALAALALLTWMLFWWPSVAIDPAAVTVRNPLRTTVIPWERIAAVESRYGLKLRTLPDGVVSAWGAPAGSRRASAKLLRLATETSSASGRAALQRDTAQLGEGDAAVAVRQEFERRARKPRPAGEAEPVVSSVNTTVAIAAAVLVIASVVSPFV